MGRYCRTVSFYLQAGATSVGFEGESQLDFLQAWKVYYKCSVNSCAYHAWSLDRIPCRARSFSAFEHDTVLGSRVAWEGLEDLLSDIWRSRAQQTAGRASGIRPNTDLAVMVGVTDIRIKPS